MKTLNPVMNIIKILKIFAIIATVFSFVSAVTFFGFAILLSILKNIPEVMNELKNILLEVGFEYAILDSVIMDSIATIVCNGINLIASGACLILSTLLLNDVQKQGYPFSYTISKKSKTYGIIFIIVNLFANFVGSIVGNIIVGPNSFDGCANYLFLSIGITLIIASFFINYGAELHDTVASTTPTDKQEDVNTGIIDDNNAMEKSDAENNNSKSGEDLFD